MRRLVSVEEARARTLGTARVTGAERVPLAEAVGRTLAADVAATEPQPPFDNAAMDGYAVRVGDLSVLPATRPLAWTVHAGDAPPPPLPSGAVVAVMTGAPVPPGTEAVVPVEWTAREGDAVRFERAPAPGQHVRQRGEVVEAGAVVLEAGTVVTPGTIGLLALLGATPVEVRRRPVVAVVATGDELVGAAETPGPGRIRDANGPALAAQVEAAGGSVLGPFVARDDAASIASVLNAAAAADLLVFAGGVSMGERDLVRAELARRGAEWLFWQVRQRPGKPLAVGTLGARPVIGLPGNPVSAAVCFEVYVRPLLAACLGRPLMAMAPTEPAVLDATIVAPPDLHTFVRVTTRYAADGLLRVAPAGAQGSHVALSLALSDGLAHLPPARQPTPVPTSPSSAGVGGRRSGFRVQGSGFRVQERCRCARWDALCAGTFLWNGIPNPQSPIPNPQSPIPNPQSPIPNPQSPIPNPQSPMLLRTVRMTFLPDRLDDFLALFREARPKIAATVGCRHLELWQDERFPNVLTTFSRWDDADALEAYRQSDLFRATWTRTTPLFAAAPVAHSQRVVGDPLPTEAT